jgi:hypothetical protein
MHQLLKAYCGRFPLGGNDLLVTAQVGNVKNNDPSLIEPIRLQASDAGCRDWFISASGELDA